MSGFYEFTLSLYAQLKRVEALSVSFGFNSFTAEFEIVVWDYFLIQYYT